MGVKTMAPHTSSRASSRAPPSSRPPSTARSDASSRLSSRSCETVRLDELAKVKKELEEALRQVKYEMKQKGATNLSSEEALLEVFRRSLTCRARLSSAMPTDWEAWGNGKKKGQGLTTRR